jgi:O-antigen/teichoic acid export membrane protein
VVGVIAQVYYPKHLARRDQDALFGELATLLAVAALGIFVVALPFCRGTLGHVFPKFAGADASTAALLVSGVPLALATWMLPLLIASARHPWREASLIFITSIIVLLLLMLAGHARAGIAGQAWGCTISATLTYMVICALAAKRRFISMRALAALSVIIVLSVGAGAIEWHAMFGAAL